MGPVNSWKIEMINPPVSSIALYFPFLNNEWSNNKVFCDIVKLKVSEIFCETKRYNSAMHG